MIENYCKGNSTSLKEIAERNGHKFQDTETPNKDGSPMNDVDSIIPENNLMNLKDVRKFKGILTGKIVKSLEDENLKEFQKGDPVVVFHLDDFIQFLEVNNEWNISFLKQSTTFHDISVYYSQ